jgi:thiol-disulfide isomerase/thioredoxin
MTIRVLTCWALCASLAFAQDKSKADEGGKPTDVAAAMTALDAAQKARARSLPDHLSNQDKVVSAAEAVLGFKDASDEQKDKALVAKTTALFTKSNFKPEAAKDFDAFAKVIETEHPKSSAMGTVEMVKFRKKHFSKRPDKVDPAAIQELTQLAKKYPKEQSFAGFYGAFANMVEEADGAAAAAKFVEEGLKLFPENRQLASTLKGLKMIGQPIEIIGPTLEGSEFNVANLKGKVVLVDFWAVWCGPCVAELPHVKEAYEKFHDKGFEIVGVSLDRDRATLEKFIKEKEMPWTQIIFSKPEEMWWKNPVAVKHGINSIPATYLIGRDGKVAARNLRGKKLSEAVAKEIAKTSPSAN